ncbi:MAG: stage III sporulation protein AE [Clostridiales bacterium]|jgi:stage III sporulation protein AE|nr:stage III sporulation protein AE [Clostridiales bacterium]
MARRAALAVIFAAALTFAPAPAYADTYRDQLNSLDTSGMDEAIRESGLPALDGVTVKGLIERALSGSLDLSPESLAKAALGALAGELAALAPVMRNLAVICVAGAIIGALSSAFPGAGAAEAGFFICYLTAAGLIVSCFTLSINIMDGMLGSVTSLAQGSLPPLMALMAFSGSAGAAYTISPALVLALTALSTLIKNLVTPALTFAMALSLVSNLSEKPLLTKLSDLMRDCAGLVLKFASGAFIVVVTIQGVTIPVLNNAAAKTAKAALNAVPVVGSAMSGAVDIVSYWAGALKSGFLAAVIIIVIAVCALPILKLAAVMLMFKLAAALMEPIADGRTVKAMESLARLTTVMLGSCVAAMTIFTFIIVVMLSA